MGSLAALVAGYLLVFRYPQVLETFQRAGCSLVASCAPPEACTAVGAPVYNTTSLKLVLPSVGQTGTTSVMQAARSMGYRSYADEETRAYAAFALMDELGSPQELAFPLSRCRVEAIALGPFVDVLPYILETSPEAKFVLTWRDFPSWIQSTAYGGDKDRKWFVISLSLLKYFLLLPWIWWYDAATGHFADFFAAGIPFLGDGEVNVLAAIVCRVMALPQSMPMFNLINRGTSRAFEEEAYLAHQDEIRRLVPPGRLLEFDAARHGWAELADFLGWPRPAAGTPFPHMRSRQSRTNDLQLYRHFGVTASAYCLFLFFAAANFVAATAAVRVAALVGGWFIKALIAVLRVVAD